jgi:hypothetical protein
VSSANRTGKEPVAESPRGKNGRFGKGNPGKPKGAVSWEKRKIAEAAREMFEKHAPKEILALLHQNKNLAVKLGVIEFLAERAYGKAPIKVHASIDPDSPEGILLLLAGQPIPGSSTSSETERES